MSLYLCACVASMFYGFTIFFAFALIYQRRKRKIMRFGGITLQLLLSILFGAWQFFQRTGETFGNPYLTSSPWRPVWTILIPCIWIVVLHSPRMNRFCRQIDEPHAKSAAPNPGIASRLNCGGHWRGVGEPDRSPK